MRAMRLGLLCLAAAAGPGAAQGPAPAAPDPALREALRKQMQTNLAGLQEEKIEKSLSVFHPDGPGYAQAERRMKELFPVADFRYELLSFELIGVDAEYAVVRFKQRTTLVGQPKIPTQGRESLVDMITIFRKTGPDWKIWTSALLTSSVK